MARVSRWFGPVVPTILVVILLLTACGASSTESASSTVNAFPPTATGTYQTLTIDAFDEILSTHRDEYSIINVHIPYEGEVEHTDVHVPYNNIAALTSAVPDKNAQIILYCRSGRMSKEASEQLTALGYTRIWDVPGGMIAWEESGRAIIRR